MLKSENERIYGGEAIASGGFGCVFRPALRCKNGMRPKNMVTKLMTTKNAIKEYEFIQSVKYHLRKIPNYKNYFVVDNFEICEPANLNKSDIENFDKKCNALKKHSKIKSRRSKGTRSKMSTNYLNKHLDDLRAVHMPDSGIDLDKYLVKYHGKNIFIKVNNALIKLLLNGIVPMNKMNVYHCDIKDTNIMLKDDQARLIDWGLSIFEKITDKIPNNLYRRPFQYNVPFSSVLFSNDFIEMYDDFLKKKEIEMQPPSPSNLHDFIVNYISHWNNERGIGHLNTINNMAQRFSQTNEYSKKDDYSSAYFYIYPYLEKILEEFTVDRKFLQMDYLKNVFTKNIDIWGFMMSYISFFEHFDNMNYKEEVHYKIMEKIKNIILHFLFDKPTEVINPQEVAMELKNLNELFRQISSNDYNGRKSMKRKSSRKNKTSKLYSN